MRISADLLEKVEQRTNPLGERELVLSSLGIPVIENMGAAQDDFDCIDMSNNRISVLNNFPKLHRLSSLLLSGNQITTIDKGLSKNLPTVRYLELSYNSLSSLVEVQNLAMAFPNLEFLNLTGNPVLRRQHYRLYTINQFAQLKTLDYQKIKRGERETATRLARSAAGAALESDLKTFTPGEPVPELTEFTDEQKAQIKELLGSAKTLAEMEEIENSVRKGILPEQLRSNKRQKTS